MITEQPVFNSEYQLLLDSDDIIVNLYDKGYKLAYSRDGIDLYAVTSRAGLVARLLSDNYSIFISFE